MQFVALNPRGSRPDIDRVPMSPRLASLDGKVVYCVSQQRPLFLEELIKHWAQSAPAVKLIFKIKPGGFIREDRDLLDEIQEKADALVYGTAMGGGSGLFGANWTIEAEKRGIPSVYLVGEPFLPDIRVSAEMRGMPLLRSVPVELVEEVRVKQDISDAKFSEIIARIEAALTEPLNDEEMKTSRIISEKPARIAMEGTLTEIQDYFHAQQWTDGLPIIPPTEEKLAEFLKFTKHSADEVVTSKMWPEELEATVEKVAMVGIMAGCKAQYLPVLLAITEAWGKGPFNLLVRSGSSASPVIIINGPVRHKLGMNTELNAMGPCNQANASIGRFMRLALINLGGLWPGVNDMSAQGSPLKYGFCIPENEEKSPWESFSATAGYKPYESTVSLLISGWAHQTIFGDSQSTDIILNNIARAVVSFLGRNGALIAMAPGMARFLANEGMRKQDVEQYIQEHALIPISDIKHSFLLRAWAESLALPDDALIKLCQPGSIRIVIAGGETGQPIAQVWQFQSPSTVNIARWE